MIPDSRPLYAPLPPEARRWSWGAFLLNWIWGIGNNTFIAVLALVPIVNILMVFVLGAKGGAWAWRNRRWKSVEHFQRVQRAWAIAGVIVWAVVIALGVAAYFTAPVVFPSSHPKVEMVESRVIPDVHCRVSPIFARPQSV